jgi:uncharacterized protein YjbI with pentapeptide repeats
MGRAMDDVKKDDAEKTAYDGKLISRRRLLSYGLAGMAGLAGGCSALAFGGGSGALQKYSVEDFNTEAQKDKNCLNNRSISDAILNSPTAKSGPYGVILEDMVIHHLTMRNVQMRQAHFKNVTFVDCTFIKVNLNGSKFENVKFIVPPWEG